MKPLQLAVAVLGSFCLIPMAQGAMLNHGNYSATDVNFYQVTQETSTESSVVYNAPLISGNTLSFAANHFDVHAEAGGDDWAEAKILFDLRAGEGRVLSSLVADTLGSYALGGTGGGFDTEAQTIGSVGITIYEVDGVAVSARPRFTLMMFQPSDCAFNAAEDPSQGTWTGIDSINFGQILQELGISYVHGVTGAQISLQTGMVVLSEATTNCWLATSSTQFSVTTAVPEPTTTVLAGLAGMALFVVARQARQRSQAC